MVGFPQPVVHKIFPGVPGCRRPTRRWWPLDPEQPVGIMRFCCFQKATKVSMAVSWLTWPMAKLSQLFGITYLVGKIKAVQTALFQGPGRLSELMFGWDVRHWGDGINNANVFLQVNHLYVFCFILIFLNTRALFYLIMRVSFILFICFLDVIRNFLISEFLEVVCPDVCSVIIHSYQDSYWLKTNNGALWNIPWRIHGSGIFTY